MVTSTTMGQPAMTAPPFPNCRYRMCDLPGQCIGEGKCHHPAATPERELTKALSRQPSAEDAELISNLNGNFNEVLNASSWIECKRSVVHSLAPAVRNLAARIEALSGEMAKAKETRDALGKAYVIERSKLIERAERAERELAEQKNYTHKIMLEHTDALAAKDRTERAERELAEAQKVIARANNSLFGSWGYFLSTNGGPANEFHLHDPIEKLKAYGNEQWRRAEKAEAALAEAMEANNDLNKELMKEAMLRDRAEDALSRQPSDMVLVPREPTQEMLANIAMTNANHEDQYPIDGVRRSLRIYRVILADALSARSRDAERYRKP